SPFLLKKKRSKRKLFGKTLFCLLLTKQVPGLLSQPGYFFYISGEQRGVGGIQHGGDVREGRLVVHIIFFHVGLHAQEEGLRLLPAPPVQSVVKIRQLCQRFIRQVVED